MVERTTVDVVILGGGATGLEFADMVALSGQHRCVGVIDDDADLDTTPWTRRDIPVIGGRSALDGIDGRYLTAVGQPGHLADLAGVADAAGLSPAPPVIHPSAVCAPGVEIGDGSVLYPNASLSTSVHLGSCCQVHLGVTLGHDAVVGDRSIITPGANISGDVVIGTGCFLGSGCVVIPGIRIGDGAIVGAGAVVTRDVPPGITAFGNPARAR